AYFTYPRILGHELAAEVVEIKDNSNGIRPGDNVVVIPYMSCGKCTACKKGITNCCSNIRVMGVHTDGGMQEFITVPSSFLLPAGKLSLEEIAIVEPLAIGAHGIRRSGMKPGDTVVVIGCGPIGIGIMKLAQVGGATVIAMDVNNQRVAYAKEEIGVDYAINVATNSVDEVSKITSGNMAEVVYDATGNKKALESGPDYLAVGGRFIMVGLSKGELTYVHPKIHSREATIMCSRNATMEDFDHVINVLSQGNFPVNSFVTHKIDYTDMIDKFDSWLNPETGVIKAMISF
ncbi:zinc-binding dehydrogenase, partial [Bacteroidota bacterium]